MRSGFKRRAFYEVRIGTVKLRARDIVLAVVLALAVVLLYRRVTRLWWTYDDAYLLHLAIEHSAYDHFVGNALWRSMPQQLYTPLLTATYDAELSLFKLEAPGFYEVQVGLLAILAITLFATLRLWFSSLAAASAALLFIAGAPICSLVTELMLVHYIESLILGVASIAVFEIALRRNSLALRMLSALLYFAAMLAKEIAVPLIVIDGLLAWRARRRLTTIAPHIVALIAYALLRRGALGVWIGGYGWVIRLDDVPRVAAALPVAVFHQLGGLFLVLVAAGVALRIRSWRDALIVGIALVVSLGPVLPMAKKFESRFAVVIWLACAVIAVAGYVTVRDRRVRTGILCVVPLLAIVLNRQVFAREFSRSQQMSDEARVFFALSSGDALRKPLVPPAAIAELRWLKETYLRLAPGARWFYDDIYLCTTPVLPRRVFSYDTTQRMVVQQKDISSISTHYCAAIRSDVPLSVAFHHEGDSLFWTFGPYERGTYMIVMGNGEQAFDIPRSDGFRLPGVRSIALRVRYLSPAGWITYSPEMLLDFSRARDFQWHR
jgi:hypothetical protein